MLDRLNNWYTLIPCEYPTNYWRLSQHTFTKDYDPDSYPSLGITTTVVAEGHHDSLVRLVNDELDIVYPERC